MAAWHPLLSSTLHLPLHHLHRLFLESWIDMGAPTFTPGLWQSIGSLSKLTNCGQIPQFSRDKVGIISYMQMHRNGGVDTLASSAESTKIYSVCRPPTRFLLHTKTLLCTKGECLVKSLHFQSQRLLSLCNSHWVGKRRCTHREEIRTYTYTIPNKICQLLS
jgi:hypothetical protein